MKFLAFVDTHQDKKVLKKLYDRAGKPDIDFLVCGGDLSIFGRGLRESLDLLNSLGKKVYFIPGNHEENLPKLPELISSFSNIVDLHGKAFEIGNYIFCGYGGNGFSKQDATFRTLARRWYGQFKGKKMVLVLHGPPEGTKVDLLDHKFMGNYDYRMFIERIEPKIVLCGHFHETAGVIDTIGKTKVVNPGWEGMVIELN